MELGHYQDALPGVIVFVARWAKCKGPGFPLRSVTGMDVSGCRSGGRPVPVGGLERG